MKGLAGRLLRSCTCQRSGSYRHRCCLLLLAVAGALACAAPAIAAPKAGLLFPERGLTRDLAEARKDIIAALQQKLAAVEGGQVQFIDPQSSTAVQALKQVGLKPGDLDAPQSAENLAPFVRALGLDWLLVLELKEFEAKFNMVKSRAWLACRLIQPTPVAGGVGAQQVDLDIVKTDGDREGLREIKAGEATPSQILAILLSNRLWDRLAQYLQQPGGVGVKPPGEGPPTTGPGSPTTGPESPTTGPTSPTTRPTSPTTGPTSPTTGPTPPTTGPTSPTTGPTSPTTGPVGPPPGTGVKPGATTGEPSAEEWIFLLDKQIREQGESAELRIALGQAYLTIGDYGQAELHLLRAAELDPRLAEPHLRLGEIRTNQSRWSAAVSEYREAVRLEPANIGARIALARAYERAGASKEALVEFEAATRLDSDNGAAHLELGDYYMQHRDSRSAEREYRQAAECAQPDARAYARLADYCAEKGRFKESFDYQLLASRHQAGPVTMDERRYVRILAAADEALAKQMADSSAAMERFRRGNMTREEAYYAFRQFADYSRDIYNLASAVTAPAAYRSLHQARLLVYSLANQADLSLLDYLDTNDQSDFETAKVLRAEAVQEFEQLQRRPERQP